MENMIFPRSICSGIAQYRNKFKKERTFKGLFLVFCGGTWYDKKVFDALISEDSVLR